MSENNFSDMFKLDAKDFEEQTNESVVYKVKPSAGKNGVYSALIRFVPWWKAPKNSYVEKWEAWLENPVTKKGMLVDCPSSINEHSELMDTYWSLKNSEDAELQDKARYFSRKKKYYAIVQILKDENRPELEGKLKIFKFGPKIFKKIQSELKPEFGTPHVPFDPTNGKPFHIKCKEEGGYPNYDESKFLEQSMPVLIGKDKKFENNEQLVEFLKENSPNLDDFNFRKWGEKETSHFNQMKELIIPSVSEHAKNAMSTESTTKSNENIEIPEEKENISEGTTETSESNNDEFDFKLD